MARSTTRSSHLGIAASGAAWVTGIAFCVRCIETIATFDGASNGRLPVSIS